ncbi:MAG: hypothetical protein ACE145_13375 [Terriglobia bacterium]
MTSGSQFEKWVAGFLGIVCVALVLNMFLRSGARAGATRAPAGTKPPATRVRSGSSPSRATNELARYDPRVQLDVFEKIQKRPRSKPSRNPFEFEAPPAPLVRARTDAPAVPSAPPKPPPPPLKAVGVTQKGGGINEAIVSDDQEIYIVHEGETFAKRFRVRKITPSQVEVDDETTHDTIRLPIAP